MSAYGLENLMQPVFVVDQVFLEVKIREIRYCASVPFVFLRQLLVTSRKLNPSFPFGTTSQRFMVALGVLKLYLICLELLLHNIM